MSKRFAPKTPKAIFEDRASVTTPRSNKSNSSLKDQLSTLVKQTPDKIDVPTLDSEVINSMGLEEVVVPIPNLQTLNEFEIEPSEIAVPIPDIQSPQTNGPKIPNITNQPEIYTSIPNIINSPADTLEVSVPIPNIQLLNPEKPEQSDNPTPSNTGSGPQSQESPAAPIAANEKARVWGDPHFVGGDGGTFDVQGEPNKTYNLLSDKGLDFHGLFIPSLNEEKMPGVTLVGKTTMGLSGKDGASEIIFEPRTDTATINGKNITDKPIKTADGGQTKREGKFLTTITGEGYRIVQEFMQGSDVLPDYIDADVHTGDQGVASDGVMAGGLLGHTFDADSNKRDGKKGKGAQGEGAIDGVFTDYEVK